MERGPLDVAKERMRLDVFRIVGIHNMTCGIISGATGTEGLVTKDPVILAIAFG